MEGQAEEAVAPGTEGTDPYLSTPIPGGYGGFILTADSAGLVHWLLGFYLLVGPEGWFMGGFCATLRSNLLDTRWTLICM